MPVPYYTKNPDGSITALTGKELDAAKLQNMVTFNHDYGSTGSHQEGVAFSLTSLCRRITSSPAYKHVFVSGRTKRGPGKGRIKLRQIGFKSLMERVRLEELKGVVLEEAR